MKPLQLKKGMFVIAPADLKSNPFVTAGKTYQVYNVDNSLKNCDYFNFTDDRGDKATSISKGCAYLDKRDWIIKDSFTLENITQLIKDTPNDLELGAKIRELLNF
jgi:hypothetical protein